MANVGDWVLLYLGRYPSGDPHESARTVASVGATDAATGRVALTVDDGWSIRPADLYPDQVAAYAADPAAVSARTVSYPMPPPTN